LIGDDKTDKSVMYFIECKYRNSKIKFETLNELMRKSEIIDSKKKKKYVLISISGFEDKLLEFAKEKEEIILISDVEMMKYLKK
jgi:hypothetical protein